MEGGKLTPDEMKFYRGVFVTLDWLNNKQIPCNPQLKLLLQSSRLPVATLGQLWTLSFALATNQKRDWLSDRDLCIVLRLIAMAQTGQVPSYEGSRVDGLPLPKIDINMLREAHKKAIEEGKVPAPGQAPGAAPPPATQAASPPRQPGPPPPSPAAAPAATAAAATTTPASPPPAAPAAAAAGSPPPPAQPGVIDWSMSDKQKLDYARSFEQLDPEKKGIIPALNAVGFLRKSKLPEEVLREIWKLSDIGRDGALDLHEFCIAMHLVLKARSNVPLPPTLPPVLLPARPQAQVEAEEKAKKEAEETRAKEQQAKEQASKEQAAKEQAAKEQQEKEAKAKEQADQAAKEQQAKEQQAKEQQAKEQQAKEQQAKQQQEEVKEQQAKQQQDPASEQKGEEKTTTTAATPAGDEKTDEPAAPPRSKFMKPPPSEGSAPVGSVASPAPAPRSRPRESPRPSDEDTKRTRSPAARNRSPATRTNVKPGEPTIGWDNTVKLDREDPLIPLTSPAKPGEAVKAQPALRAWIETLLVEKIAPGINLFDALKSGVRLCKMLNVIDPNSILDISTQQFMRKENISSFLDALRKKGFKPNQLFLVDDLLEQKDMEAVYSTLIELDTYAERIGFEGARLKR